jgi:hypothetical protein
MRIVPFEDWTLLGQWFPCLSYKGQAEAIIVHHSVTKPTENAFNDARVVERVIYGRRFDSRFGMIAYSYMIHPDGTIFEGRGLSYRNGANKNTKGGSLSNGNTVSVCLIGDYRTNEVTSMQIAAFNWLRNDLVLRAGIIPSATTNAHNELSHTACPVLDVGIFDTQLVGEEEPEMMTCFDKLTGEAWVCGNGKARPISDVNQWMKTWEGPTAKANHMKHVVADLYEII